MVVAVKKPSLLHQKFSCCDVDMLVVSFNFVLELDYPLRVRELVVDAPYDLPLLEPYNCNLEMM